jgi:5'-nucleotidase
MMIQGDGGSARDRTLVLTNDDGIGEPGLEALYRATEGLGTRRIVAPFGPYSGCGHVVTTDRPVVISRRGEGRHAVEGTPADCVRMAMFHLEPGLDWVVAGINPGGNLGTDVYHSGTVAAAREAAIQGRPAIAVSHYIARGRAIDWPRASRWARGVLVGLMAWPWEPGTYWNVNLPHPEPGSDDPPVVFCPLDTSALPLDYRLESGGMVAHYRGDYQARRRVAGADVDVCFGGRIAVTRLRL